MKDLEKEEKDREKLEKALADHEFIQKGAKVFAWDLIRYQENGGDMENITASKVYRFLEELDKKR
ncbi:MAG: hypothetical protein LBT30_06260 [Clostridiales bacterium]|jgi:hypothetical protein|nr:hypothetical protein [Clostridiales bacterium]